MRPSLVSFINGGGEWRWPSFVYTRHLLASEIEADLHVRSLDT